MSYSGLQNYYACHGGSSNEPKYAGHLPCRTITWEILHTSISASATVYKASSTRPQYDTSAYSWCVAGVSRAIILGKRKPSPYGKSGWWTTDGQQNRQPAYDFERLRSSHDILRSTSPALTQQSTHRLPNLVHASGLEATGLQEGSHATRTGKGGSTAFSNHRNTGVTDVGLSSPVQGAPHGYTPKCLGSVSTSHTHRQSGASQQALAASAAEALAGAVSRSKSNQQSPALVHHQPPSSTPSMGNAPSRDGCNLQSSHTTASLCVTSTDSPLRVTQQSAQHNRGPPSPNVGPQTQRYANTSAPDPSAMRTTTKAQVIDEQGTVLGPQPIPCAKHHSVELRPYRKPCDKYRFSKGTVTQSNSQTPSGAMPSFIDPSQAFNPFNEEDEPKKRAAAEVEAGVHRKAAKQSPGRSMTGTQIVTLTESTAVAASRKTVIRKEDKSETVSPVTSSPQTSTTSQATLDIEVDMASEMKAMIQRMREWKNKDPSMFQKLWDDLQKSGTASSSPSLSWQIAQAALLQNRIGNTSAASSVSNARNVQGPRLPRQLNGYKLFVEDNDDGLPALTSPAQPALAQTIPVPPVTSSSQTYRNGSRSGLVKAKLSVQKATLSSRFLNQIPSIYIPPLLSNTKSNGRSVSWAVKNHLAVTLPNLALPILGSKNAFVQKA
jgi:hypothetical protein